MFILLYEGNVRNVTSNYGVDKHNNNFLNYVLNMSLYEVVNTNEVSTLDVDDRVYMVEVQNDVTCSMQ